jgi:hypothetical protein
MTPTEAQELLAKHGSMTKAAAAVGMSRNAFKRRLDKGATPTPPTARHGRTFSDFRAEYDKDYIVPKKIREGLAILGDGWEYESAFVKLAGVSLADIATYRDSFSDHVVQLRRDGKRAWAGTKALAKQMREVV